MPAAPLTVVVVAPPAGEALRRWYREIGPHLPAGTEIRVVHDGADGGALDVVRELAAGGASVTAVAGSLIAAVRAVAAGPVLVAGADAAVDFGVIGAMLAAFAGGAEVVVAARPALPARARWTNRLLRALAGSPVRDATLELRLFDAARVQRLDVATSGGGGGLALLVAAWTAGARIVEVPARDAAGERATIAPSTGLPRDPRLWARALRFALGKVEVDAAAVWAVWLCFSAAVFWLVYHYGANVPFKDDFDHLEQVVGAKRLTLRWLWEPFYDHRVPTSRFLWWVMAHLSNANYFVPTYLDAILLSGIAAAWLVALRRIRGAWSLWDVWIPVVVLHFGQVENLIWGHELALIGIAAVYTLLAWLALFHDVDDPRVAAIWGVSVLVISGFCAPGVAYASGTLVFFPIAAATLLVRQKTRRAGLIMAASWLAFVVFVVAYRYGWKPEHGGTTTDPHKIVDYACKLAAVAWSSERGLWQINSAVTVLFVFTGAAIAALGVLRAGERRVWLARLVLLGSFVALVAAMSWGRGRSREPFWSRYTTLLWPFVLFAYAIVARKLSAAWLRLFGLVALCTTMANLPANWAAGMWTANEQKQQLDRVELLGLIGASPKTMGDLNLYSWQPPSMVTPRYALLKARHQSFFGGSAASRRARLGELLKKAAISDGSAPARVQAADINVASVEKRDAVLLVTPATMEFPLPRGRFHVHARCGLGAGSLAARFSLELVQSGGTTTPWQAELDPARERARDLDVDVTAAEAATLRFAATATSAPASTVWWTAIAITPR